MKIAKGDTIIVYHDIHAPAPVEVEVLAVTPVPGKTIGVVFDEAVDGGHTCDGRGPDGKCLWLAAADVLSPEKAAEVNAFLAERALAEAIAQKDFVLEIGNDGTVINEVAEPAAE